MSENHRTEHTARIKTPKQLVIVVVLAFVVSVIVIVTLAQLAIDSQQPAKVDASTAAAVAQRIKPVGDVVVAAAGDAQQGRSGRAVVEAFCTACHGSGALNAPKIGDTRAWSKLIQRGLDSLTANAVRGIRQMPARAGNPDLTDVEIARAIVFMANQSGGNLKAPVVFTATVAVATAPAAAPSAPSAPSAPNGNAANGKRVYDATCAACHGAGVAGAPRAGDKTSWASRLQAGKDALYASVIKGKGVMPPKGGNASLSDADIKAAVDYLAGLAN